MGQHGGAVVDKNYPRHEAESFASEPGFPLGDKMRLLFKGLTIGARMGKPVGGAFQVDVKGGKCEQEQQCNGEDGSSRRCT